MSIEALDIHGTEVREQRIVDAIDILKGYTETTPLVRIDRFPGGATLLGKYEAAQVGGSFKSRGAYVKMHQLSEMGEQHAVCASAGNHAIGVALAAKQLMLNVDVYLPYTVSSERVGRVIAHSTDESGNEWARVIRGGETVDEALELARLSFSPMVEPFDDLDIIAGQATVGAEIIEQTNGAVDRVFVPVGGGGLAAGTLEAFSDYPDVEIVLVQLAGNDSAERSFYAQNLQPASAPNTLAIGSAVSVIGQNCLDVMMRHASKIRFMTVGTSDLGQCLVLEDRLRQEWASAMGEAAYESFPEVTGVIAEAGARKLAQQLEKDDTSIIGETWVAMVTGSNIDEKAELAATRAYHDSRAHHLGMRAMMSKIGHTYIGRD